MNFSDKIYIAGHNGMVGAALLRKLNSLGYTNIIHKTSSELDLRNQQKVRLFFQENKPEFVFLAAAKVGGIVANSNYKADGYSKINNTIYEYHGDFWHGNPKIYNPDDINSITKTTYKELYDKTMQKQSFCEDNHYKYVSIWESEWLRGKNALIKIQRKYKTSQN